MQQHFLSKHGKIIVSPAQEHPNCPMQLWCRFIKQGQDTLHILCTAQVNKNLSAYAVMEGQFYFNQPPLAPIGKRLTVFLDMNERNSQEAHAVDGWYVCLTKQHCHSYRFYIPDTKRYRVSNTAMFFLKHCTLPAIKPGETIQLAAQDLIMSINDKN